MGPMNDDYDFSASKTMLDTMVTPSSFLKYSLPTDALATTPLVAHCQTGDISYMEDIYQDQVSSNRNDFQPPDDSYIPNEQMTSEQTFYNSDLPYSEDMYTASVVSTPEQTLVDSDLQPLEGKCTSHTAATPIQTLSGTLNEISDGDLKKAAEEMKKSGSQLPLIKQELWYKIQSSRLANGKPELKIETEEPKVYELTPKEKQNLEKRRENNRQSAKKCRQKKRNETEGLYRKHRELAKKNKDLKMMVQKLEKLKSHYWSELVTNCPVDTMSPEDLYKHINPDFEEQQVGDGA